MLGQHIDTLNVYLKPTDSASGQNESIIWTKKGNQGNAWIEGKVSLNPTVLSSIIFEGIRGTGFNV
jgi:hypothetical protein